MATAITPDGVQFSDSSIQTTAGMPRNQQALIIGGTNTNNSAPPYGISFTTIVNNINSGGVVQSDTSYSGTARLQAACAGYGYTKSVHYGGWVAGGTVLNTTNMISANGTIDSDTTSAGAVRYGMFALSYGGDKGMVSHGAAGSGGGYQSSGYQISTNLISNTGVVQSETIGAGQTYSTMRVSGAACSYGLDKGVFLFGHSGYIPTGSNISDSGTIGKALVSNTGVISLWTAAVYPGRVLNCAAGYGSDKGFTFGGGYYSGRYDNTFNLIDNQGSVSSSQTFTGTLRDGAYAATIGLQGIIFGGATPTILSSSLIVSKTGSISAEITTVATARTQGAAASYG